MSSANYYLAQAFSAMLKTQASAESVKTISMFIHSSGLANGKKENTANAMCFINLKKSFSTCFLHTPALTISATSERIHLGDCLVDFYQEPRKAIFQG